MIFDCWSAIEEVLTNFMRYFSIVDQIDFEDELLELLICIMKRANEYLKMFDFVKDSIHKIYIKNNQNLFGLYEFFYVSLSYGERNFKTENGSQYLIA